MKKIFSLITAVIIASLMVFTVSAESTVTYSGNSGEFIFAKGSEHSPTDLFENFKNVLPGDSITQQITVKNNADNKVKVKIYMRSLGAHPESNDFLSQLNLKVSKSAENDMAYMFDAAANETAGLTDWVELGTLYSGGVVNLDVELNVPTSLSNEYSDKIGYLDWEFKVEELPISPEDPKPPQTGDYNNLWLWVSLMAVSALFIILLIVFTRKKREE